MPSAVLMITPLRLRGRLDLTFFRFEVFSSKKVVSTLAIVGIPMHENRWTLHHCPRPSFHDQEARTQSIALAELISLALAQEQEASSCTVQLYLGLNLFISLPSSSGNFLKISIKAHRA